MNPVEKSQDQNNRRIPFWRQIRWNLILYSIMLTVIPVLIISAFILYFSRNSTISQLQTQLESISLLKQQQVSRWLDTGELVIDSVLTNPITASTITNFLVAGSSLPANQALVNRSLQTAQAISSEEGESYFREFFVYNTEGRIIAASDENQIGKVVTRQPYFTASLLGNYLQAPYYDVGSIGLTMFVTRPLTGPDGLVVGVLAGRLDLTTLGQIMTERSGLGETGETYLVSRENNYLLTPSRFEGYELTRAYRSEGIDQALQEVVGSGLYPSYRNPPAPVIGAFRWVPELEAGLIAEIEQAEALAPYDVGVYFTVLMVLVMVVVVSAISLFIATQISRPIISLSQIATRIAGGDLSQRASMRVGNEIGILSQAFDDMTNQLQDLIAGLEGRVAARTRDLATTIEVGSLATSIYSEEELLPRLVEFIRSRFNLYYTQIYLLDDAKRYAVLRAGTGDVGRQLWERGHRLDVAETSLVARAIQTGRPVLVPDTTVSAIHKPNPLLPDTRSEITIPLTVGTEILGVLDMQSQQAGTFNEDNLPVFQAMAGQIAAALQGAVAFEQARVATERAEAVNRRLTSAAWQSYLGDVAQGKRVGYQYDLEAPRPLDHSIANLNGATNGAEIGEYALQPIELRGQQIGTILVKEEDEERRWTEAELSLIREVSDRVAQALEQYRAFDQIAQSEAEVRRAFKEVEDIRFAIDQHTIVAITDQRGIINYVNDRFCEISQYSRQELLGQDHRIVNSGSHPKEFIRDLWTTITNGRVWQGEIQNKAKDELLYWIDTTIIPFLNDEGKPYQFIALSTDITERKHQEEEIARRAAELQTVAEVSAASTTLLNPDDLLQSVSDLTKERFGLYHAHVYLLNDSGDTLLLAAGAGEPGALMKARGHSIPLNREHSLVARAGRTLTGVISNDVTREPDFLPNPLLPETRSEMSIPLVIRGELLGVLDVQSRIFDRFSESDVQVMTTLADQVAGAVQNARSYQETQEALESLDRIYNMSVDLIGSANFEGYFVQLNPAWSSTLGYSSEELMSQPFVSFVHPDDVELTNNEAAKIADGATAIFFQNRYRCYDGSYKWISWNATPDLESQLIHFVARDITASVQAQQEQEILYQISAALTDAQSPAALLAALDRFALDNGSSGSSLLYVDSSAEGEPEWAEVRAIRNLEAQTPIGTRFYLPQFPFAQLWISNPDEPIFIDNVHQSDAVDPATGELLARSGTQAMAIMPLYVQDRWLGLMIFNWAEPRTFSQQERNIFVGILGQTTSTADAIRAAEATRLAREEAEILYRVSALINEARDEQTILDAITQYALPEEITSTSITTYDTGNLKTAQFVDVVAGWRADGLDMRGMRIALADFTDNPYTDMTVIPDVNAAENLSETNRQAYALLGVVGIVVIPLEVTGHILGSLTIASSTPYNFTERDLRIFRTVAEQAATALERINLTQQIERRASELETVATVSAATTTILEVADLLQSVADLTKASFGLYHAHIYLMDEESQTLVLTAGADEIGRKMTEEGRRIPLSRTNSLVVTAARERRGIIANDVASDPNFLPNPLLPETRSEMAIPMIVGDNVIGVLDTQSDVVNHFTEDDLRVKTTLADQVAVAVQNALAYKRQVEIAERLREVDKLKSQFLANMSHELRTPLNSIIGYAEVLLDGIDGDLTDDAVEDVEAIHSGGKHLLAIINDILDLAKIEAGQMFMSREPANLPRIVDEVVQQCQILIKDKDVVLAVEKPDDLPPVHGDPLRLKQIIYNLVNNAIKFTEQGGVTVDIDLHNSSEIAVRVRDTGIGMTRQEMGGLFQQFHQVDGSATRRAGGTGLGLVITRHLIHMHEGEIYVESEKGVGTTFWFTLPVYTEKA